MQGPSRRSLLGASIAISTLTEPVFAGSPPERISLWPTGNPGGDPPGLKPKIDIVDLSGALVGSDYLGRRYRNIAGVLCPDVEIFTPTNSIGVSVLVIPGGGFRKIAIDKEGRDVAKWLAARGIFAGVLTYRLPAERWPAGEDVVLQDAQRAMRILAGHSGAARLGALGFSAGGTIAMALATRQDELSYPRVDALDDAPARVDFLGLGYAFLNVPKPFSGLSGVLRDLKLLKAPAFYFAAGDDPVVPVRNSIDAFIAGGAPGSRNELHVFASGGHGFGLTAPTSSTTACWPDLFLRWLEAWGRTPSASGLDGPPPGG